MLVVASCTLAFSIYPIKTITINSSLHSKYRYLSNTSQHNGNKNAIIDDVEDQAKVHMDQYLSFFPNPSEFTCRYIFQDDVRVDKRNNLSWFKVYKLYFLGKNYSKLQVYFTKLIRTLVVYSFFAVFLLQSSKWLF